jgi:hypothetical protein
MKAYIIDTNNLGALYILVFANITVLSQLLIYLEVKNLEGFGIVRIYSKAIMIARGS